ncbi:MAG: tail fiber domain-containing protein [Burkholderiaceae bacterium]|nr:tail fiber domain-containing protein [Burkholderiaceae bacterium]
MTTSRNQRIQDEGVAWGRGLDMAGLGRGMVGASQGAYGLAVGAGNSAVANNSAPSNSLLSSFGNAGSMYQSGMAQGANTIMGGRQMALGGLTNVAQMQNTYALNSGTDLGGVGALIGGAAKGAQLAGMFGSDRRLKVDIVPVERDARGVQWVEFSYVGVPGRVRGVIAQDVAKIVPEAVSVNPSGFLQVDYTHLR